MSTIVAGTKLRLRPDLKTSADFWDRNAYLSWGSRLEGKELFLIDLCESAYSIGETPDDKNPIHISGHPTRLFAFGS